MVSDALEKLGNFSETEKLLFCKEVKVRSVRKNEVLLSKGEVARSVFYNLDSLTYQHHDCQALNIIDLHLEKQWVLSYHSFVSQLPSESFLSVYRAGTLLELSIQSIHYLMGRSSNFIALNRIMESPATRIHLFDHALDPMEKYRFVLEHSPDLVQAFPLKTIASYLKITPETLSRVREKFVRSKIVS